MSFATRAFVSLSLVTALAACGESVAGGGDCRDGTPIACTCPDGRPGAGVCGVDGCDCPARYALEAEPGSVDFGEVARGTSRDATVLLHNPSPREVRLRSATLSGDASGAFLLPDGAPATVPAGGGVPLAVRYTAVVPGTEVGRLRVEADDADVAAVEVTLLARVPGPALSCGPAAVDFGSVWLGTEATAMANCTNVGLAGANDDAHLVIEALDVTGAGFSAAWADGPPPASGLAVGESAGIVLAFEPTAAGQHQGRLRVIGAGFDSTVPLQGLGAELPACDVSVLPAELRFGIVDPGSTTTVEFAIRNNRADAPCTLRNLQLCEGTAPAFELAGGPYAAVELPGGGEVRFGIALTPGEFSCEPDVSPGCLEFDLSPSGHRSIPFRCSLPEPSGLLAPNDVDFGTVMVGCATRVRELQLINVGSRPVALAEVGFGEGTSEDFSIWSSPPPGTTVPPGLSALLTVAYSSDDEGLDEGTVFVRLEGESEPYVATLRGQAALPPPQRDSFHQGVRPKLDLLFVIDNGSTMATEAARLGAELGAFFDLSARQDASLHVAVTTTGLVAGGPGCPGGVNGGEDGRFFPVDGTRPRILDETAARATFEANLAVGTCHTAPPQTLEAAVRALTPPLSNNADDPRHGEADDGNLGFLRPDAHLWILAVSDRTDVSPGTDDAYYQALLDLKGAQNAHLLGFMAITGDRGTGCVGADGGTAVAGDRLIKLADRTQAGTSVSICGTNWAQSLAWSNAGRPRSCFFLGNQPEDSNGNGVVNDVEGELRVYVGGVEVPSTVDGSPVWRYHGDQVAVCFAPDRNPAEGAAIDIEYRVACLDW